MVAVVDYIIVQNAGRIRRAKLTGKVYDTAIMLVGLNASECFSIFGLTYADCAEG
jgi:hypothetical protein